jgi:SAM-dependent methyltransferase
LDAAPNLLVDACCLAEKIPLKSACIDIVFATEILEHVEDAEETVREIGRVLRPGGYAVITVPFMYPTHEAPYDFRRFTHIGIGSLFERAGFDIIDLAAKGGPCTVAGHLAIMVTIWAMSRVVGDLNGSRIGRALKNIIGGIEEVIVLCNCPSLRVGRGAMTASLGYMLLARTPVSCGG